MKRSDEYMSNDTAIMTLGGGTLHIWYGPLIISGTGREMI